MQRRELITLLGGTAAWPLAARAQQSEPMRRIGALMGIGDDERAQAQFAVFVQALAQLGWMDGRNVRIDYRWGGGDIVRIPGMVKPHQHVVPFVDQLHTASSTTMTR